MNYFAHLFLARRTADSHLGNLLGDFRRGAVLSDYSGDTLRALENHYLVDRFTDAHPRVKQARDFFSPTRRRFAPVALDVLFDHFLIRHWSAYTPHHIDTFRDDSYRLLRNRLAVMPPRMQQVINHMTSHDGLMGYETLDGVGRALHFLAKRIRFRNDFAQSIADIEQHYAALEATFLTFFPDLLGHVSDHDLEDGTITFTANAAALSADRREKQK